MTKHQAVSRCLQDERNTVAVLHSAMKSLNNSTLACVIMNETGYQSPLSLCNTVFETQHIGCDHTSIKQFFALNQCTEDGPKCANNVLAGFLKKCQDSHNPRSIKALNPRALLETTCRNMMRFLEEKSAGSMTFT